MRLSGGLAVSLVIIAVILVIAGFFSYSYITGFAVSQQGITSSRIVNGQQVPPPGVYYQEESKFNITTRISFPINLEYSAFIFEDNLPEGFSLCSEDSIQVEVFANFNKVTQENLVNYKLKGSKILIDTDKTALIDAVGSISNLEYKISYELCNQENAGIKELQGKVYYAKNNNIFSADLEKIIFKYSTTPTTTPTEPTTRPSTEIITGENKGIINLVLSGSSPKNFPFIVTISLIGKEGIPIAVYKHDSVKKRINYKIRDFDCLNVFEIEFKVFTPKGTKTALISRDKCPSIKKNLASGKNYKVTIKF